jgi:hypothetical protein
VWKPSKKCLMKDSLESPILLTARCQTSSSKNASFFSLHSFEPVNLDLKAASIARFAVQVQVNNLLALTRIPVSNAYIPQHFSHQKPSALHYTTLSVIKGVLLLDSLQTNFNENERCSSYRAWVPDPGLISHRSGIPHQPNKKARNA